jgi:DinB superfamily
MFCWLHRTGGDRKDSMKRRLAIVLLFTSAVLAQEKNPVSTVLRESLPRQQKNLVAAAEEMPAEKYSYKPTDQQMEFGHLVVHVLQTNNFLCSKIGDVPEVKAAVPLQESDGKDKLVAGLKASFDFCTTVLSKLDDSKLGDEVELFGGRKGSRALAMFILSNSWADHYSAAAMYLRLSGLVPPTAQAKK